MLTETCGRSKDSEGKIESYVLAVCVQGRTWRTSPPEPSSQGRGQSEGESREAEGGGEWKVGKENDTLWVGMLHLAFVTGMVLNTP